VILDSQMAGGDFGPDIGQNATRYYNAVRQLGTAVLVIDHVPKSATGAASDHNANAPIGSVAKSNRARQTYELQKHQLPGQSYSCLSMKHTKNNEGKLTEDFGIKITWVEDPATGHLDRTLFTTFDIATHPILSATQVLWKRLWDVLDQGPLSLDELCKILPDKTEGTIKATLYQNRDKFVKVGEKWGRLTGVTA